MKSIVSSLLAGLSAGFCATAALHANSPSMVQPGKLLITPSYTYQSYDEFYAADKRQPMLPTGGEIERESYRVYLDYGLAEKWSLDFSVGYFRTDSRPGGPFLIGSQDGVADTYWGIRYALATQAMQGVDLALRVGATLPGDYETGQLSTPGDDAFGADVKLFAGRSFGSTRVESSLGYGLNEGAVPETCQLGLKVIQQIAGSFWIDAGYTYFDADGGLDIGGPGFSPRRLSELGEQGEVVEVGLATSDKGGRYYRIYGSQLIDGRNIGREKTFGASVTFPY